MNAIAQQSLNLLRDSLAEAQMTVRAYDNKAQIVGVGYMFALAVVGNFEALLPKATEFDLLSIAVACGSLSPILLFGFVLYPSRKSTEKFSSMSETAPEKVLYVDPTKLDSVNALIDAVGRCDPIVEVSFELLKVSQLRELKRRRFLRALILTAVVFTFVFASHFIRML